MTRLLGLVPGNCRLFLFAVFSPHIIENVYLVFKVTLPSRTDTPMCARAHTHTHMQLYIELLFKYTLRCYSMCARAHIQACACVCVSM